MPFRITTLLMFEGQADEAMRHYVSLFEDAAIEHVERYVAGEDGPEGTIKHASFRLGEQTVRCIDSPINHPFTFTPAMSLVVDCETEAELDRLFDGLSDGGTVLMPLGAYPFNPRFGWLTDRHGVSWQLGLARD